ncbi:MAG: ester cyclase [Maricaulaceae bacterium]
MTTLPITQVATTDLSVMLNPQGGRRMELPGFDSEFVDFPDYIIRITDRIWHDRDVELCAKYYTDDCLIHTLTGQIIGAQTVIDNTYATMKAFPDRVLDADNVIWSDDGDGVFYSSHLITSKMTNLGPSEFGAATGRKVRVRTIADCACKDNKIFEEWLVRDYAAMVIHMGFDVDDIAAKLAADDIAAGTSLIEFHAPAHADVMAHTPKAVSKLNWPETNPPEFAQLMFANYLTKDGLENLSDVYDFRVSGLYPGDRDFYGHDELGAFWAEFFTALPDARIRVEHVADIPYLGEARDMAVRWSLAGHHTGEGLYGEPTGAPVYIKGVSHWRIMNGRIRQDVTVWDDVAVRRQIETARQSNG